MSNNKYSVTITAKSGDKVLTELIYPKLDYGKFVEVEAVIVTGLIRGGLIRALDQGEDVSDWLLEVFGVVKE